MGRLAEVHLECVGHVAIGTRVKHTTKLRVVHGQGTVLEEVVWAVLVVPGFFRVHF